MNSNSTLGTNNESNKMSSKKCTNNRNKNSDSIRGTNNGSSIISSKKCKNNQNKRFKSEWG